uniref:Uncharacterized protein n=1 Tax=Pristionchus pacificus TaxID=54126 RepID=A0A2A6CH10_PRIPA|eukprot:PDM77353.1 hypothetical protein PRIPAC_33083 [Pristionchus pacificus]
MEDERADIASSADRNTKAQFEPYVQLNHDGYSWVQRKRLGRELGRNGNKKVLIAGSGPHDGLKHDVRSLAQRRRSDRGLGRSVFRIEETGSSAPIRSQEERVRRNKRHNATGALGKQ